MPATNYLIKSQPESALLVSSGSTVENDVGICYFDPVDETLKEISLLDNHLLTVQPYKKAIKKYYLVISPSAPALDTVEVGPVFLDLPDGLVIDPEDYYSIKTLISVTEPTLGQFDDEDNMNSDTIASPNPGDIIPIWFLVESKLPLNNVLNISIEVDYE